MTRKWENVEEMQPASCRGAGHEWMGLEELFWEIRVCVFVCVCVFECEMIVDKEKREEYKIQLDLLIHIPSYKEAYLLLYIHNFLMTPSLVALARLDAALSLS